MLLTSCGFKLTYVEKNHTITGINTFGENHINFKLKNKLPINSKYDGKNKVELEINTKKIKRIKEKNISNQITKYELNIITSVKFTTKSQTGSFQISKLGDYNVSNQYSETLNREKNVTNSLVNGIVDEIIDNLTIIFNDS